MTQADCYKLLKKHRKWMTVKEIAAKLKTGIPSCNICLSRLVKNREAIRRIFNQPYKIYQYKYSDEN